MGYKQIETNMTFAEASLISSMEHNRSLKRLEKINQVINWSQVEEMLSSDKWPSICSEGVESSGRCKYRQRSARTRSSGRINHETAPLTEYFEVNGVSITEKLISICR